MAAAVEIELAGARKPLRRVIDPVGLDPRVIQPAVAAHPPSAEVDGAADRIHGSHSHGFGVPREIQHHFHVGGDHGGRDVSGIVVDVGVVCLGSVIGVGQGGAIYGKLRAGRHLAVHQEHSHLPVRKLIDDGVEGRVSGQGRLPQSITEGCPARQRLASVKNGSLVGVAGESDV